MKRYKINIDNREELVHIDSVCMFRADIPPLQENSKNKYGGAHYYLFYDMKAYQMDQMWLSLTTSLVAEEGIAHSNIVFIFLFCWNKWFLLFKFVILDKWHSVLR